MCRYVVLTLAVPVLVFLPYIADMVKGEVVHMQELGITESFLVKRQVLLSAAEVAEMILRVDDIIRAQPRSPVGRSYTCIE